MEKELRDITELIASITLASSKGGKLQSIKLDYQLITSDDNEWCKPKIEITFQ